MSDCPTRDDLEDLQGKQVSLRTTNGLAFHGVLLSVNKTGVIVGTGPDKTPQPVLYENIRSCGPYRAVRGGQVVYAKAYLIGPSPEEALHANRFVGDENLARMMCLNVNKAEPTAGYKVFIINVSLDPDTLEEV